LPTPLVWQCQQEHLTGFLHLPQTTARHAAILLAGGTQSRIGAHRMLLNLADNLVSQGVAVLRFDVRGRGDSDGEYPGFCNLDADIASAAEQLRLALPGLKHVSLIGHCDGAAAAAFACGRAGLADSLVLINPWARTAETQSMNNRIQNDKAARDIGRWKRLFSGKVNVLEALKSRVRFRPGVTQTGTGQSSLLDQWREAWRSLGIPTLVVTGSDDASGQEFLALISMLQTHPKAEKQVVKGGNHSFSTPAQSTSLYAIINQWFQLIMLKS
jgi:uncharacterized protein